MIGEYVSERCPKLSLKSSTCCVILDETSSPLYNFEKFLIYRVSWYLEERGILDLFVFVFSCDLQSFDFSKFLWFILQGCIISGVFIFAKTLVLLAYVAMEEFMSEKSRSLSYKKNGPRMELEVSWGDLKMLLGDHCNHENEVDANLAYLTKPSTYLVFWHYNPYLSVPRCTCRCHVSITV